MYKRQTHNSEMEFDVNNQLGDPKTLAQITMEIQDSGTRGQDNRETETQRITPETLKEIRGEPTQQTIPETPKEIDISAILQQISSQMQEQSLQQAQTLKQIQEQVTKQIQEQSVQQTQTSKQIQEQMSKQIQEQSLQQAQQIQQLYYY